MSRKNKTIAALGLLTGFLVMVWLTRQRMLVDIDLGATKFLQTIIPRELDLPFSVFSLLGSTEIVAVIILALAAGVFLKFNKIFWGLGLMAFIYATELLGKFFIYHPGPPKEFFRYSIPFAFPEYVSTNYSFPSGHTSRALFLAVIIVFLVRKKWVTVICCLLSVVMLISRVYLGEHWLSDTLGGVFLGSSVGILATMIF